MKDWLYCFQSFGFILAVNPKNSSNVLKLFSDRDIDADIIGQVNTTDQVILKNNQASQILFDFKIDEITGIRYKR